jgi:CRISPR-associated endoribonuclease Cas6
MQIAIGNFEFILEARDAINMPPYKGSTLRGGFGSAFRRIVCIVKGQECAGCLLKGKCVYSYIFETPPPADTKIMRKYEAAPHPFIIEPPAETNRSYKPGDTITFGLTLIGRAVDYLPYFIYTFEELGKTGLGRGRGGFELRTVLDHGHTIYSSETRLLNNFEKVMLPLGPVSFDADMGAPSRLTLNFLTPTRITYNGRFDEEIEFHVIIRNLLRRISNLYYFHGDNHQSPELDFKNVIKKAQEVKTVKKQLRQYDWERYSGRQEQKINMSGFVGGITFEGEIAPYMPLLKAGEILHIGKGTVFGMGRYNINL